MNRISKNFPSRTELFCERVCLAVSISFGLVLKAGIGLPYAGIFKYALSCSKAIFWNMTLLLVPADPLPCEVEAACMLPSLPSHPMYAYDACTAAHFMNSWGMPTYVCCAIGSAGLVMLQ